LTQDEKRCRIATTVGDGAETNLEGGDAMFNRLFSVIILSTLLITALLTACSPLGSTPDAASVRGADEQAAISTSRRSSALVPNAGQMDPAALFSTLGSASTLFFTRHEVVFPYFIEQDPAGEYDTTYPLLINPALDYSTYVGGTGEEMGSGVAVDANNNVYITGLTNSPHVTDFGPGGDYDIFVIKLDPSQTGANQLVYEIYIGGTGRDRGYGIAVDSSGNAYVAGYTDSTDFPVTANAYQNASGVPRDAVVVQLDAAGAVNYASYLGGDGSDEAHQVVIGDNTPMYVVGYTDSTNFPTKSAFQTNHAGAGDAFVAVLDPSESGDASLVYSTYYGGSGWDAGWGIDVSDGIIYFAGHTTSDPLPLKNAIQQAYGGAGTFLGFGDAYVAKLDPSQSGNDQLLFATYLGGANDEICGGIAADASGDVCAVGTTTSADFPTTDVSPPYGGSGSLGSDAFLARIRTNGSSLAYSRFVGGSSGEEGSMAVVLDPAGNAYLAGSTGSDDFPTVNPIQADFRGGGSTPSDVFVAEFDTGGAMTFGTYLGGSTGTEAATGIALGPSESVYVTGMTDSTDFDTVNPYQDANAGGEADAFVARISNQFTLTVNRDGGGSGTVTSAPVGISCGADCTEPYVIDTVVTLTAHPGVKSYLASWGGDCSGTGLTATVTMDTDKTCAATFGYPVGGVVVPVDKLSVLSPWMGLAALVSIAALTVVLVRRRGA
jgi:hypothetical protein